MSTSASDKKTGPLPPENEAAKSNDVHTRSAWAHVQLARHPKRPHSMDYIERVFSDFQEIHGDRLFADDPAIVCGYAMFRGRPVVVIGQQKGRDTKQKLHRNFGMPKPEGYRKALRVMRLAAKFRRPIFTLLDTPGAYPGVHAEERGQAEAIARNLHAMAGLPVPFIAVCIGEGGSGGALALGVGNRVLMFENAVYSVISPESCAAIVWRDSGEAEKAAEALKLTSDDLLRFGLIDEIITEPAEGAHADYDAAAKALGDSLHRHLKSLSGLTAEQLIEDRYRKFRLMGSFFEDGEQPRDPST
ncbi:MAG: acetyl-CoA carboxylase carboxyltransferase subunit alpha [Bryobacterales bacterium]|nr:acetyl-CoA carboxylase carboxyltransferase subunit alpha [Bryobacterales bacterium]MDE0294217.1 acetyl-CoA carboxylase carboxyltransferase subunit alpha [Bryobacterales bacterium]